MSAAGGAFKAFGNAATIGASAIQIFGASPQSWRTKLPDAADAAKFQAAWKASEVKAVYLHAAYLVNLATENDELYEKSITNLSEHLAIAKALGANGLIFHIGSGENMKRVVAGMKQTLKNVPGTTQLIIENSAAGGKKVGGKPEDIGAIMNSVKSPRVKVCLDTAHIFEAGEIESYTQPNIKKLFDRIEASIGVENLVAMHVNDSKTPFNSHHDRHENIGQGHIGLDGFKNLAKEKRTHHVAWLLEVPGMEGNGPDKENVDILKKLFVG